MRKLFQVIIVLVGTYCLASEDLFSARGFENKLCYQHSGKLWCENKNDCLLQIMSLSATGLVLHTQTKKIPSATNYGVFKFKFFRKNKEPWAQIISYKKMPLKKLAQTRAIAFAHQVECSNKEDPK